MQNCIKKLGFVLMLSLSTTWSSSSKDGSIFTRLALGRQSRIEKTSLAFPSGSSGRKTPMASTSIWYKQLENTGSGSSRRYSFNKPAIRHTKRYKKKVLVSFRRKKSQSQNSILHFEFSRTFFSTGNRAIVARRAEWQAYQC